MGRRAGGKTRQAQEEHKSNTRGTQESNTLSSRYSLACTRLVPRMYLACASLERGSGWLLPGLSGFSSQVSSLIPAPALCVAPRVPLPVRAPIRGRESEIQPKVMGNSDLRILPEARPHAGRAERAPSNRQARIKLLLSGAGRNIWIERGCLYATVEAVRHDELCVTRAQLRTEW